MEDQRTASDPLKVGDASCDEIAGVSVTYELGLRVMNYSYELHFM